MIIRKVTIDDRKEWARMRNLIWPDSNEAHIEEIDTFFKNRVNKQDETFVLERDKGFLGGFIELSIRNYAEGSIAEKVPYVEGWYVDEDIRGKGFGAQLIATAENWALEKGFSELASDAEIDNSISITIHNTLGFKEVDRIVCFLKKLKRT